jgi:PAS domain-containing protein
MSRMRKKFILDSMKDRLDASEAENARLRAQLAKMKAGADAGGGGSGGGGGGGAPAERGDAPMLLSGPGRQPTTVLDSLDYLLMDALATGKQSFVLTDPSKPDNPIVYASQGFYELSGYGPDFVLGRNCRFMQGPLTDPVAIQAIRSGIANNTDTTVTLVNYRYDGSTVREHPAAHALRRAACARAAHPFPSARPPLARARARQFWNHFFIAALRGRDGAVVNYVGVQMQVSEGMARKLLASTASDARRKAARAVDAGSGGGGGGGSGGGGGGGGSGDESPRVW